MENNITVLIPAYNPTQDLLPLTEKLISQGFNVLVVNDGSRKESNKIFKKLNKKVIILKHPKNMGKGQALKTGFKYILENIPCIGVITADADGQHHFDDILNIANNLIIENNSLILGARSFSDNTPFRNKIGNIITRFIFKIATKTSISDTQTGLRGIPFNMLEKFIHIDGQRYEYEINMLIYCCKQNINIKEVAIQTIYINKNQASSFKVVKDSYKIYKCIFINSGLITSCLFAISALLSFLLDFTILFILKNILYGKYNENIALLICVVTARIFSSLFNFIFNKTIVFKSKGNLFKSLVRYYSLVTVVTILNYTLLNLLTIQLDFNLFICKIAVEIILFVNNYIIQKSFVFKKGNKKVPV